MSFAVVDEKINMYESRRKVKWNAEYTDVLFEIWRKYYDQLRGNKKNAQVYSIMVKELETTGVIVSPRELRNKINNMLQKYRDEKSRLSTGSSTSRWQFFGKINEIVGDYPNKNLDESDAFDEALCPSRYGFSTTLDCSDSNVKYEATELESSPVASEVDDSSRTPHTPKADTKSRKRKSKHTLFLAEVLQEVKKTNRILERELLARRKLAEEMVKNDRQFQTQLMKFQNDFLDIMKKKINS